MGYEVNALQGGLASHTFKLEPTEMVPAAAEVEAEAVAETVADTDVDMAQCESCPGRRGRRRWSYLSGWCDVGEHSTSASGERYPFVALLPYVPSAGSARL